jgi:hypothetical protein
LTGKTAIHEGPPASNEADMVKPAKKEARRYQVRQFLDMIDEFELSLEE